ncbi:MAG: hypothetical protein ACJAU6_000571 [Alphaproteobacteria bacterium]|jgi:hypothetical protein
MLLNVRRLFIAALIVPLAAFGSLESLFAPKPEPWLLWEAHDPDSQTRVDHRFWDGFLRRYVSASADGVNRVAYNAVGQTDKAALDAYLDRLAVTRVSELQRASQLAYWINLYNALTVRTVLAHYPVESIRDIDISPGLFSNGPWGKALTVVAQTSLSLNDIEHRILRPIWREPRLHYALNCAALGCPNLQRRAFTVENTPALLDAAARAFINNSRGAWVTGDTLTLSSLYVWFVVDFGGDEAGVLEHLKKYAEPGLLEALDTVTAIENDYKWSLNELRSN